jgi:hypothetical protein
MRSIQKTGVWQTAATLLWGTSSPTFGQVLKFKKDVLSVLKLVSEWYLPLKGIHTEVCENNKDVTSKVISDNRKWNENLDQMSTHDIARTVYMKELIDDDALITDMHVSIYPGVLHKTVVGTLQIPELPELLGLRLLRVTEFVKRTGLLLDPFGSVGNATVLREDSAWVYLITTRDRGEMKERDFPYLSNKYPIKHAWLYSYNGTVMSERWGKDREILLNAFSAFIKDKYYPKEKVFIVTNHGYADYEMPHILLTTDHAPYDYHSKFGLLRLPYLVARIFISAATFCNLFCRSVVAMDAGHERWKWRGYVYPQLPRPLTVYPKLLVDLMIKNRQLGYVCRYVWTLLRCMTYNLSIPEKVVPLIRSRCQAEGALRDGLRCLSMEKAFDIINDYRIEFYSSPFFVYSWYHYYDPVWMISDRVDRQITPDARSTCKYGTVTVTHLKTSEHFVLEDPWQSLPDDAMDVQLRIQCLFIPHKLMRRSYDSSLVDFTGHLSRHPEYARMKPEFLIESHIYEW